MNHGSRRCLQDLHLCSDKISPLGNIPICRIDFLKRKKRQMNRSDLHPMFFRSLFEIRKPIQNGADLSALLAVSSMYRISDASNSAMRASEKSFA